MKRKTIWAVVHEKSHRRTLFESYDAAVDSVRNTFNLTDWKPPTAAQVTDQTRIGHSLPCGDWVQIDAVPLFTEATIVP